MAYVWQHPAELLTIIVPNNAYTSFLNHTQLHGMYAISNFTRTDADSVTYLVLFQWVMDTLHKND